MPYGIRSISNLPIALGYSPCWTRGDTRGFEPSMPLRPSDQVSLYMQCSA